MRRTTSRPSLTSCCTTMTSRIPSCRCAHTGTPSHMHTDTQAHRHTGTRIRRLAWYRWCVKRICFVLTCSAQIVAKAKKLPGMSGEKKEKKDKDKDPDSAPPSSIRCVCMWVQVRAGGRAGGRARMGEVRMSVRLARCRMNRVQASGLGLSVSAGYQGLGRLFRPSIRV